IEEPIRNSKNNRRSFKRLGVMLAINLLFIAGLLGSNVIQKNNLQQQVTDVNYPGALATVAEVQAEETEPIPPFSEVFDDLPQAHLDGSNQGLKQSDLIVGEYGETENYDATIALIGSSHSEHWQGALLKAIEGTNYRLITMTRSGTRFSTGYEDDDLKGIWNNHVLDYLKDSDVDLVISHATASNTNDNSIQQQMIDQLQFVHDEYGIEALALRDNPRYSFNVLESLETAGYEKTKKKMNADNNQQDESFWQMLLNKNTTLHTLDLTEYYKDNGEFSPEIGNIRIYRDERHMTNTLSENFRHMFKEELEKILE